MLPEDDGVIMETKPDKPDKPENSGRWRAESLANQALYGLHAAIVKLEKLSYVNCALAFVAGAMLAVLALVTWILSDTAQAYQSLCN